MKSLSLSKLAPFLILGIVAIATIFIPSLPTLMMANLMVPTLHGYWLQQRWYF
jgi:hypothetical protein